jgi:hypothetical protein
MVEERSPRAVFLDCDPAFDQLRCDPQFSELIRLKE